MCIRDRFINSVNGKALDIAGGNVKKGQNVGVWDVNGILNAQHWKIAVSYTHLDVYKRQNTARVYSHKLLYFMRINSYGDYF